MPRYFVLQDVIPDLEPGRVILLQRKKIKIVLAASKKAKIRLENKMSLGVAHGLYICQSAV